MTVTRARGTIIANYQHTHINIKLPSCPVIYWGVTQKRSFQKFNHQILFTVLPSYVFFLKSKSTFVTPLRISALIWLWKTSGDHRFACNGNFTLLNGSVILVVIGYIQFAVNIVIPRHHHRLLCPKKWTKKPLISVRSKITQTINLILCQIALTTIFDDNHQLWSKSSSCLFFGSSVFGRQGKHTRRYLF